MVEKISAVTLRVANMRASVRFYKDVLGLEIIYGGEGSDFTSLRTKRRGYDSEPRIRQCGYPVGASDFSRFSASDDPLSTNNRVCNLLSAATLPRSLQAFLNLGRKRVCTCVADPDSLALWQKSSTTK